MKSKLSSISVSSAYRQNAIRRRRLGKSDSCFLCGENRPAALIPGSKPRICGRCQRKIQGKTEFDLHHVAGKNNHALTVPIPINDHRARLSIEQLQWPARMLRNRNKSPLLAAAACVQGFINFYDFCVDELLRWIPPTLESLDSYLTHQLGPRWWAATKSTKQSKE
jgi:hypothetical protein